MRALRAARCVLVGALAVLALLPAASSAQPDVARRVPAVPEARRQVELGNLEAARRILDISLRGRPDHVDALVERGGVHFMLGNMQEALRDYDQAAELAAQLRPHLWQRGITLYYLERWDDCLAQFVEHRKVNPNDVENAAWHFLCAARRDGLEAARGQLLPVGRDARIPLPEIYALYAGRTSPREVLATAEGIEAPRARRDALFYAHLYLGLLAEVRGEHAAAARHLARATEQEFPHFMGEVARVHLELLASAPKDPR